LEREQPDCVCLQEMPEQFIGELQALGYFVTFAPMTVEEKEEIYLWGVGMATKVPVPVRAVRYFGNTTGTAVHQSRQDETNSVSYRYLMAEVPTEGGVIPVATTHLLVTPDGKENDEQNRCVEALLGVVLDEANHVFCGDFNMPRGYNANYERFLEHYVDAIPKDHTSSLDRTLHRMGDNPNLNAPIFDAYMVDYIFTQRPYVAKNVRLEFGVSDHAAVIADIEIAG
jgi:endonuclease/exonuclease/phosphatase family metal-dependent hydrolase